MLHVKAYSHSMYVSEYEGLMPHTMRACEDITSWHVKTLTFGQNCSVALPKECLDKFRRAALHMLNGMR